jgi:hypothetical protein
MQLVEIRCLDSQRSVQALKRAAEARAIVKGVVARDHVALQLVSLANRRPVVFTGSFTTVGSSAVLTGKLAVPPYLLIPSRIGMLLLCLVSSHVACARLSVAWQLCVAGLLAGVVIALDRWFTLKQMKYLETALRDLLHETTS